VPYGPPGLTFDSEGSVTSVESLTYCDNYKPIAHNDYEDHHSVSNVAEPTEAVYVAPGDEAIWNDGNAMSITIKGEEDLEGETDFNAFATEEAQMITDEYVAELEAEKEALRKLLTDLIWQSDCYRKTSIKGKLYQLRKRNETWFGHSKTCIKLIGDAWGPQ
jgi:hypothetical protein